MIWIDRTFAAGLAMACLSVSATAAPAVLSKEDIAAAAHSDALTIPTPGEFMSALGKLGKIGWAEKARPPIATSYTSRPQAALNLGSLIADGYLAVEAEDVQQVKNLGKDIQTLARVLAIKKSFIDRGNSLTSKAEEKQWDVLKVELEATQNEVKLSLVTNKDQALIDLLTVGAWVRALEVVSGTIAANYTPEGARLLRQPAIASYLRKRLDALPDKMREDDSAVKIARKKLIEIEMLVTSPRDKAMSVEDVKKLNEQAAALLTEISKKDLN